MTNRKQHTAFKLIAALLALPLLSACQWMKEDYDQNDGLCVDDIPQYINLTISVSAGNAPVTRALTPQGGEDGDGREAGFHRENVVRGVTLFFYTATAGINADAATPIAYTAYYPLTAVGQVKRDDAPASETGITGNRDGVSADEYVFTTGNQLLEQGKLDPATQYHVIAVLNANLKSEGLTTLGAVRDYQFTTLYQGAGSPANFTNFVMTSEQDYAVQLSSLTGAEKEEQPNAVYYKPARPLRVERLAARIDFWADSSTGYKLNDKNGKPYSRPGYEYTISGTDAVFVVTRITPFNMNNGGEWLVKRTDATSGPYLADESTTTWVLSPDRDKKDDTPNYASYLGKLADTFNNGHQNDFSQAVKNYYTDGTTTLKLTDAAFALGGKDNVVVGYPMENTLLSASPLKLHATGVVIEGDYYENGDAATDTPVTRYYYGYLRHQGELSTAYDDVAMAVGGSTMDIFNDAKVPKSCGANVMNFGVVRNNIYRLSIEMKTSTPKDLKLILKIKVKKWDEFFHDYIYM